MTATATAADSTSLSALGSSNASRLNGPLGSADGARPLSDDLEVADGAASAGGATGSMSGGRSNLEGAAADMARISTASASADSTDLRQEPRQSKKDSRSLDVASLLAASHSWQTETDMHKAVLKRKLNSRPPWIASADRRATRQSCAYCFSTAGRPTAS